VFHIRAFTHDALRPRAEGWSQSEGKAYIKINSAGLRDREHTKVKPANTLRVAILGDSYAEAMQLSMKDAFWTVLERELGKCPEVDGRQVEVINFGVAGYGTAQELYDSPPSGMGLFSRHCHTRLYNGQ